MTITATAAAEQPGADPAPQSSAAARHRGDRGLLLTVALLSALLIALLVVLVIAGLDVRHRDAREAARRDAAAAATVAVPKVGSYSYTSFDADAAAAKAVLTQSFAAQYDRIIAPTKTLAEQQKAVVRSAVRQAQVINVDSDSQVKVLVLFDQQTTAARLSAPMLQGYAFTALMQKQGGRWLMAALETAVTGGTLAQNGLPTTASSPPTPTPLPTPSPTATPTARAPSAAASTGPAPAASSRAP